MSVWVVDASVAAKWYLSEPHSEEAIGLLDDEHLLVAPDLLFLEVGSALWKRVRRAEIAPDEALEWLAELSRVPLLVEPAHLYSEPALRLALRTERTVYDSLYLAVALGVDGVLVTADRKSGRALTDAGFGEHVMWVGDLAA